MVAVPEQAVIATIGEVPVETSVEITGCERVRQEVAKYDGWDVAVMTAISMSESGCREDATGDGSLAYTQNGRTYGYSLSVFQVRILPGRERCDAHDVAINVECAYGIWKSQGYGAWSVYQSGKYKQFL